jgi:DNA-binding response OmpR family regulator
MATTICVIAERSEAIDNEPAGNFERTGEISAPRVLVVDDEPLIRWSVSESLSDFGYRVDTAADAASALRIVTTSQVPFQAIVLDLRLPDMHDLSLLGTLRQLVPGARLILMTAFGTTDVLTEAHDLGADVLPKPFELDELHRLMTQKRDPR